MTTVLLMLAALNYVATQFGIDSWVEGLKMAMALWLITCCLNARNCTFEGGSVDLFLLNSAFQGISLGMACTLLAHFGTPEKGS
jgi:predicted benzoate:H+ symporter BenE